MMQLPDREQLERLSTAEIFRWIFLGAVVLCVPYYLLMGLLALFGWQTVNWNGQPLTGVLGLVAGPCIGLLLALILTASIGTACLVALRVFGVLAGPDDDEPESTTEDNSVPPMGAQREHESNGE